MNFPLVTKIAAAAFALCEPAAVMRKPRSTN